MFRFVSTGLMLLIFGITVVAFHVSHIPLSLSVTLTVSDMTLFVIRGLVAT